ncbi:MAG: cation diffusion facilitator family transporter [bacterium]|nr:cation diffusion facilitator family transporter [bacterium]
MENKKSELNSLKLALIITFVFALVEFIGGFLTNSLALISDAGHMITDSFSLFISFLANYLVLNLRNNRFSFGLYRLEVLAAFVNAIFLLGIVAFILFNGINRIIKPEVVLAKPMLFIALLGLIVNVFIIFILFKHSENLNIKSALLHVISDTLGSVVAIVASVIIIFTKFYQIDPILSIVISLLMIPSVFILLYQSIDIFLEAIPKEINLNNIANQIKNINGILDFHDLHIWSINPKNNILTVHVVKDKNIQDSYLLDKIKEISKLNNINHITIQIEDIEYECFQDCNQKLYQSYQDISLKNYHKNHLHMHTENFHDHHDKHYHNIDNIDSNEIDRNK